MLHHEEFSFHYKLPLEWSHSNHWMVCCFTISAFSMVLVMFLSHVKINFPIPFLTTHCVMQVDEYDAFEFPRTMLVLKPFILMDYWVSEIILYRKIIWPMQGTLPKIPIDFVRSLSVFVQHLVWPYRLFYCIISFIINIRSRWTHTAKSHWLLYTIPIGSSVHCDYWNLTNVSYVDCFQEVYFKFVQRQLYISLHGVS